MVTLDEMAGKINGGYKIMRIENTKITYKVAEEEFSIPNGRNMVYGRIYRPEAEGEGASLSGPCDGVINWIP